MNEKQFYEYNTRLLPEIRLIGEEHLTPPTVHKRRKPGEYIIYVTLDGTMDLEEDEVVYHLIPGDFLVLDPEKIHGGIAASACSYYYIHFHLPDMDRRYLKEYEVQERMLEIRAESLRSDPYGAQDAIVSRCLLPKYMNFASEALFHELCGLINEAISFHRNHREGYKAMTACNVLQMLVLASRQYLSFFAEEASGTAQSLRKVYALMDFLNVCYEEPISGQIIEEKFGSNFDYLNRIFHRATHKTIFQYLTDVRMAQACELMQTTSLRIADIGERVGIPDTSYFSKVFKKHIGVAPANYSKEISAVL